MSVAITTPLVLASHNAGKLREIEAMLAPLGLQVVSAGSLNLPEPEETGDTFEANAGLKALAAAQATGLTSLADDSGLSVDALDGAPGIYSARWAGPGKDFPMAMARIERELRTRGVEPEGARARFVCVLTLADAKGQLHHMRGEITGQLTFPPRGEKGFGYDPIFVADGMRQTFAEIDAAEKHAISHRARAFALLQTYLDRGHAA
jgi:XTP/dITP diphosphohydrolase